MSYGPKLAAVLSRHAAAALSDFYPGVSAAAARDAVDFSDYVDSYVDGSRQVVA